MNRNRLILAVIATATLASAQPSWSQNGGGGPGPQGGGPPPQGGGAPPEQIKKHHHGSGVGAAIGAGVVGGLVGGALLNSQRQAAPGYDAGAYAPPPPPPPAYEADDGDEPVCRIVRRPVYDEDGDIVDYRTRRICR